MPRPLDALFNQTLRNRLWTGFRMVHLQDQDPNRPLHEHLPAYRRDAAYPEHPRLTPEEMP